MRTSAYQSPDATGLSVREIERDGYRLIIQREGERRAAASRATAVTGAAARLSAHHRGRATQPEFELRHRRRGRCCSASMAGLEFNGLHSRKHDCTRSNSTLSTCW